MTWCKVDPTILKLEGCLFGWAFIWQKIPVVLDSNQTDIIRSSWLSGKVSGAMYTLTKCLCKNLPSVINQKLIGNFHHVWKNRCDKKVHIDSKLMQGTDSLDMKTKTNSGYSKINWLII